MNPVTLVKYLFSFIGAGLLLGAVYLYHDTQDFVGRSARAEGRVIDLEYSRSDDSSSYRPVVRFTPRNGNTIEFVSSVGSNPPAYDKGERVEVLYLPDNPHEAEINGFMSLWFAPVLLGFMGTIFFGIGAGFFIAGLRTTQRHAQLRTQGTAIKADLTGIERLPGRTLTGSLPWHIVCQWQNPMTSNIHVFKSEGIGYDPTNYIGNRQITVFIDRDNPEHYVVDISFLPKLAN